MVSLACEVQFDPDLDYRSTLDAVLSARKCYFGSAMFGISIELPVSNNQPRASSISAL